MTYTVKTVAFYTVNGRTLQQTLVRYSGANKELFERMTFLCAPVNSTVEQTTVNGNTITTITSKD